MIDLPFNTVEFAEAWGDFLEHKKEMFKFEYKNERSMRLALKKLVRYSHNNEKIAIAILENSISENWKGFFPLKNNDPMMIEFFNSQNKPKKLNAGEILKQKYGLS